MWLMFHWRLEASRGRSTRVRGVEQLESRIVLSAGALSAVWHNHADHAPPAREAAPPEPQAMVAAGHRADEQTREFRDRDFGALFRDPDPLSGRITVMIDSLDSIVLRERLAVAVSYTVVVSIVPSPPPPPPLIARPVVSPLVSIQDDGEGEAPATLPLPLVSTPIRPPASSATQAEVAVLNQFVDLRNETPSKFVGDSSPSEVLPSIQPAIRQSQNQGILMEAEDAAPSPADFDEETEELTSLRRKMSSPKSEVEDLWEGLIQLAPADWRLESLRPTEPTKTVESEIHNERVLLEADASRTEPREAKPAPRDAEHLAPFPQATPRSDRLMTGDTDPSVWLPEEAGLIELMAIDAASLQREVKAALPHVARDAFFGSSDKAELEADVEIYKAFELASEPATPAVDPPARIPAEIQVAKPR